MSGLSRLFGLNTIKKEYALIPTVVIIGGACVMCASYVSYMALSKSDATFRPWSWGVNSPYNGIKPEEVRKFLPHRKPHELPSSEVEALKREVASS